MARYVNFLLGRSKNYALTKCIAKIIVKVVKLSCWLFLNWDWSAFLGRQLELLKMN